MNDNAKKLKKINLFLFDMDGTIYLGDRLYDFTLELLDTIKKQGKRYMFMTNNSSKSVSDYIKKLDRFGIVATEDEFITSSQAMSYYLKNTYPDSRLYICGTQSFKDELSREGFTVTNDAPTADVIVMGNDQELTFKKLEDVCRELFTREVPYVATNLDYVCPTEFGSVPDCGSICEMIYNCTKKHPFLVGKPEALMPKLAMESTNTPKEHTAVIGDRIYTDVKCGLNAGVLSILVMSGETDEQILQESQDKPDIVLKDCSEITEALTI